jgi:hypothetical protein
MTSALGRTTVCLTARGRRVSLVARDRAGSATMSATSASEWATRAELWRWGMSSMAFDTLGPALAGANERVKPGWI